MGLIGSQHELANEYEYTPFGEREYAREDVPNALQFQARHYDPASKLYAWRARWYDPSLARLISEDPIGLEGGINPYVFAENNPVNFTDPFGLQAEGGNCDNPNTVQVEICEITAVGRPRTGGGSGRSTPLSCRGPCTTPSGPGSTPGVPIGSGGGPGSGRPSAPVADAPKISQQCLVAGVQLALSVGETYAFFSGLGLAYQGARIYRAGRAGTQAVFSRAVVQGRGAQLRRSRAAMAGGRGMVGVGLGDAFGGWAAGLQDNIFLQAAAGDDRWWALLPGGSVIGALQDVGQECFD